jgi:hypothetical protein
MRDMRNEYNILAGSLKKGLGVDARITLKSILRK